MKNMGKITLIFMLGIIVSFSMNVAAEVVLSSESVSYFNSKTNETTVNGALNELFSAIEISNQIGDMTKISNIGDGTIAGSISTLGSNIETINNTVSKLDNNFEKNNLGTQVNLNAYTSQNNAYTFPCDGYLNIRFTSTTQSLTVSAKVVSADDSKELMFGVVTNTSASNPYQGKSLFVKKGMKVYVTKITDGNVSSLSFFPLE